MDFMLKKIFHTLFNTAMNMNRMNILALVESRPGALLLDLGCDDGGWTRKLADKMQTDKVFGVEIVRERGELAMAKNISVSFADLSGTLPYNNGDFDVIHANQVIEHVPDIDHFLEEIHRLLKPDGIAILSTENGSSWHNIFASVMGWQIFSLTNLSGKKLGIGNPLAIHRGKNDHLKSWTHKVIFNYRGLIEFCEAHGFVVEKVLGAGYYPFPSTLGKWDPRHAHFLSIRIRKG